MKKIMKLVIAGLFLTGPTAWAEEAETYLVKNILNPVVVVHTHLLASVQPTAELKFTYSSCAAQEFQVKTEQKENTIYASVVVNRSAADCRARAISREYSLQISSDFRPMTDVVLLKPLNINNETHQ